MTRTQTTEITTVKDVGISCLNLHRFWRFYSFVFSAFNDQFEKLHQTLETVLHQVSEHIHTYIVYLITQVTEYARLES